MEMVVLLMTKNYFPVGWHDENRNIADLRVPVCRFDTVFEQCGGQAIMEMNVFFQINKWIFRFRLEGVFGANAFDLVSKTRVDR